MRFHAILNREGGTLRTTDLDAFARRMTEILEAEGHSLSVELVEGAELEDALEAAAGKKGIDVVIAGGGDGTISAAAARLAGHESALAVLPAGTMNLFARSLDIPLDLEQAVEAFATGSIHEVDLAKANDRIFIHQFSMGMHAKLVAQRERMEFGSRLGKMRASAKAAIDTLRNPPSLRMDLEVDGNPESVRTSAIGISNNLFGEGHLPYADDPAGGVLGIYVTKARSRREMLLFSLNMALGRWQSNAHVDVQTAQKVVIRIKPTKRGRKCVIDGELTAAEAETTIEIMPGALKVLRPA